MSTDRIDWASPPPRHPGPVIYYTWHNEYIIPAWLVERLRTEGYEHLADEMVPVRQGELDDALARMEDTDWRRSS
jgi:hypothetical protein